jgi:choline dehydrogenase-like flavoprotein
MVNLRDKVDLLVVGSGAAGSVFAAEASAAGKQVVLLEAGPARTPDDLVSSQLWARRLKWGGAHVEEEGNHQVGHSFNAGWGIGGSTMHHYGVWPRLHKNDFQTFTEFGQGLDWPLQYDELRPYYDRIQSSIGLSGDATQERWRPPGEPYPMPPVPVFGQGRLLAEGFARLDLHTAPLPLAVNTIPYRGRPACMYDGWCDAGCPIGALGNAQTVFLAKALKSGAEIRDGAMVTRLLTSTGGQRIEGVEYHSVDGVLHRQYADVVVLAAFTVQNARLLLASANSRHPRGLANHSGLVGRYLMTHPAVSVYGMFDAETQPGLGPTGGQLMNQDGYDNKLAVDNAYGSFQWIIANAVKPNGLLGIANNRADIYGPQLKPFLQRAVNHIGVMTLVSEDIALAENRVELSSARDAFGVPLARAVHNLGKSSAALVAHAMEQGKAVMDAAGAREQWRGPQAGMHIMGGTVMGSDPSKSVTNSYGQSHDINNLYIAGPGLFPGSGAVNPTFTIHALALRAAEHLLRNWP